MNEKERLRDYLEHAIPYSSEELARITESLNDKIESKRWENEACSHQWIDPNEPPISRAPYVPVVGSGRRQMKPGVTYRCTNCGQHLSISNRTKI